MADNKKSVLLYCDIIHTVEKLDDETAGKLFKHYLRYVNDLEPETDNLLVEVSFESMKQNLKRDLKKWEQRAERSRANGNKGGRPKKTQKTQQVNSKPKKPVKDTVTVKGNVKVKDKINNVPSFEDFKNYAIEKSERLKIELDFDKLELKYESWKVNDWKDGNDMIIKNWKSKLLNTIPYLKKEKSSGKKERPKTIEDEFAHLRLPNEPTD